MIDFQNADEIYSVYGAYPGSGKVGSYMIGRFMVENGKLRILEDHRGLLNEVLENGPVQFSLSGLNSLQNSSHLRIVAESEITKGHHIHLIPKGQMPRTEAPQPQEPPEHVETPSPGLGEPPQSLIQEDTPFAMQTPPAVFDYLRVGMREPQVIEVRGNTVYMNGQELSQPEVTRILETLSNGLGKLKYRKAI